MIGRLMVIVAAFAAVLGLVRAGEPENLTVVRDCPATGWHRACLPIAFYFRDDGSGRLHFKKVSREDAPFDFVQFQDVILVKGALLEGGGAGAFKLILNEPVGDGPTDSPEELGAFAFVGRSRAGRPIVLTDRGPFEIETPSVVFESTGDLFVADEKTGRLRARLVAGYAMPFVVTKAGEIGIWDAKRTICITAPSTTSKDIAIVTSACKSAGIPLEGAVVSGNIEDAPDVTIDQATKLIGQEPVNFDAYRAPGTGLLLIWANWQECC